MPFLADSLCTLELSAARLPRGPEAPVHRSTVQALSEAKVCSTCLLPSRLGAASGLCCLI